MQYLLLFLEGIITFVSPCLLPMLPIYISYFAAGNSGKRTVLTNAAAFVGGFTFIFVLMGAFAGTIGRYVQQHQILLNVITGSIVILFGLNFLGWIRIPFLNRVTQHGSHPKRLNALSAALFGIVFSIGWTPCVGAFLGSALMMASYGGSALDGVYMLLAYSLGLGVPFILSALLIDQLKGAFDFIKRHYKVINAVSGALLIVVGILMISGLMGRFLTLLSI